MKTEKMKAVQVWAIVDHADRLVTFDARCPIYWFRKIAAVDMKRRGDDTMRVVRVVVSFTKGDVR